MKNKPLLLMSVLTALIIGTIFSCQKFETEPVNTDDQEETALADVLFSPEFDWETTRIITLTISSGNPQILNISSTDKQIRYYKGMHPGTQTEVIKISIPAYVDKLSINNQVHNLNSDKLNIAL